QVDQLTAPGYPLVVDRGEVDAELLDVAEEGVVREERRRFEDGALGRWEVRRIDRGRIVFRRIRWVFVAWPAVAHHRGVGGDRRRRGFGFHGELEDPREILDQIRGEVPGLVRSTGDETGRPDQVTASQQLRL